MCLFKHRSAGASIDCVLWELGRKDHQSSWGRRRGEGRSRKERKNTHLFHPACACACPGQRCQGAMPRLMPSRAQAASSLHDLACHGRPAGQAGQPSSPHGVRAAFSASMAAAFGAPAQRDKKHRPPPHIPSHHAQCRLPTVRGRTEHAIYLPFLALMETFLS